MARPISRARHEPPTAAAGGWPVALRTAEIAAMLNFEIIDHPVYSGIELQRFDDAVHGSGMLVMLIRSADRKVDVYLQPGLRPERAAYGVGGGLGEWVETAIDPAILEVTPFGVHTHVRLHDSTGRLVEVRVDDRGGRPRRHAGLLAPAGANTEDPASLLLVWMQHFDLVRRTGPRPVVRICDEPVRTGRLPGSWLHRRHLIKYAADLLVVQVNPADEEPAAGFDGARLEARPSGDGAPAARLEFAPPLPRPGALEPGAAAYGRWTVAVGDDPAIVGGTWTAGRDGATASLALDVTRPWRPRGLPPLMRMVTTLAPVFRKWPTTYRWHAEVPVGERGGGTARWERIGSGWDSSYRRISH